MGKEGIRGVGEGVGVRDGMRGGACIFVAARRSRTCELTNNCG